jgi:RNA polymerase sigma-70 factor, ECF subfamily
MCSEVPPTPSPLPEGDHGRGGHAHITSTALLDSLHDSGNAPVWEEFDGRYRPIIIGFAMKLGLSQQDAADVAQQALAEFVRDYRGGKYSRDKGRLSSWLISIARHRAIDVLRASGKRRDWRGESAIDQTPAALQDSRHDNEHWKAERKSVIIARALAQLRSTSRTSEHTIRAFELVALRGVPVQAVAEQCGMSADEVYVAKNRVTKQLREIVEEMTKTYDDE